MTHDVPGPHSLVADPYAMLPQWNILSAASLSRWRRSCSSSSSLSRSSKPVTCLPFTLQHKDRRSSKAPSQRFRSTFSVMNANRRNMQVKHVAMAGSGWDSLWESGWQGAKSWPHWGLPSCDKTLEVATSPPGFRRITRLGPHPDLAARSSITGPDIDHELTNVLYDLALSPSTLTFLWRHSHY